MWLEVGLVHFHCVLEIRIESSWLFNVSECEVREGSEGCEFPLFVGWILGVILLLVGSLGSVSVADNLWGKISLSFSRFPCSLFWVHHLLSFFQTYLINNIHIYIYTHIPALSLVKIIIMHKHPNHNARKEMQGLFHFNLTATVQEPYHIISHKIKWEAGGIGTYHTSVFFTKIALKQNMEAPHLCGPV